MKHTRTQITKRIATTFAVAALALSMSGTAPAASSNTSSTSSTQGVASSDVISVGTWNICNQMCEADYRTKGPIKERAGAIAEHIEDSGVSFVGFQEANDADVRDVVAELDGWATTGGAENLHMAFDTEIWAADGEVADNTQFIENSKILYKKKTPYLVLEHRASGQDYLFIDTHLYWGSNGRTHVEHRADQARKIMADAKTLAAVSDMPIVVMGDMNGSYGELDEAPLLAFEAGGYTSAFATAEHLSPGVGSFNGTPFGDLSGLPGVVIDHIFVTDHLRPVTVDVISDSSVSDHNLVVADLVISGN